MSKRIKVSKRDLYLLLIGVLLASMIQVLYDEFHSVAVNQIILNWIYAQTIIVVLLGISLLIIMNKLVEK
jgi:hypothetical protein